MNKIFVVEGTDGSGKQTQSKLLNDRLIKDNYSIYSTSFPNYDNQSSGPVKEYLSGNISNNPEDISAKAASTFYAVDRYISYKENFEKYYKDDKTIILFDRYVSSNIIFQGTKIYIKTNDYEKLDEFIGWLCNLEHNDLELPKPTVVFFLYMPIEYSLKLMQDRDNKFSKEKKKDIHESNAEYLKNVSDTGLYIAKKLGWTIIECVKDGNLRTIEDINNEMYDVLINNL